MKHQWQKILAEAGDEVPSHEESKDSNARAGDEREDGDVVSKWRERKYRIGRAAASGGCVSKDVAQVADADHRERCRSYGSNRPVLCWIRKRSC